MKRYDKYKDSGIPWLGQIPEHWEVEKLKRIATCNTDVLSERTSEDLKIKYVEIADVTLEEGIKHVQLYSFGEAPSRARRKTQTNDIIISTVRTYLKAIAVVTEPDLIVSTGFAVIRSNRENSKWLYYAMLNNGFLEEVVANSIGINYPAISTSKLGGLYLPLPPLSEQAAIVSYLDRKVSELDSFVSKQETQISYLKELKQATIAKAVTRGIDPSVALKDSGIAWLGQIPEHWEVRIGKRIYSANDGGVWGDDPDGDNDTIVLRQQSRQKTVISKL